jgi:hypothetical protein
LCCAETGGRRKVCAKWIVCILNGDRQATCVLLVNVYFQWWRSIPGLHFDSGWIVAALTWSRTEVSNCRMVFCCVSVEKVA